MTYSTLRCYIYNDIKNVARKVRGKLSGREIDPNEKISIAEKFMAGGIGGAIGCMVGNPFDVYKIRLINDVDLSNKKYSGLLDCMKKSYI